MRHRRREMGAEEALRPAMYRSPEGREMETKLGTGEESHCMQPDRREGADMGA